MGNPIEIDGGYPKLELPPPLKGQHTMEILEELGYSQSEVQKMVSEGVVYGTPPI
jgi:crotonobetainyl-CoA:carnitine CoA-transferase CaiB-like acyl-CoA transferase